MASDGNLRFPCDALPQEGRLQRLMGVYAQREPGLLMQRVRLPGGRVAGAQLRALAEAARRFTPGLPLHLTTRQDIELHGLTAATLPAAQAAIASAGLTGLDTCGDTLRNVTVCPGSGLCSGRVDVHALGEAIRIACDSLPFVRHLPRKFKISVSGCSRLCARPWINDVGLAARADGRFDAVVAGSLGSRPGAGMAWPETLSPDEVTPFVVAAMRLFNDEGDRTNRKQARLRHVRERMGDEVFRWKLRALFREEVSAGRWPAPAAKNIAGGSRELHRRHLPLGDLSADAALQLADAIAATDGELRIGFEHDLLIFSTSAPKLDMLGDPATLDRRVVACPGTTWCPKGIADSRGVAAALRAALPPGCSLSICISGCPNGCSHPAVADIGLVGRIKTIDNVRTDCFRLLLGGGRGSSPVLAQEFHEAVPAARVPAVVRGIAEAYAASSAGEAFGNFVRRERARLAQILGTVA